MTNSQTRGKKIRYAVLGLGYIAQEAVLPAFKNARQNSKLTALVSSDPEKLRRLSRRYDVRFTYSYDEFEKALHEEAFDAVYIATPNSEHEKYAILAMKAGCHVLCEKPLTLDQESCQLMLEALEKNPVHFMVGYRLHFDPANLKAIEIAHSKRIGELRLFTSNFCTPIRDRSNVRLQSKTGGGPLMDIGIYGVNAARYLFRDEPTEVFAYSATNSADQRFIEVDEMLSVVMKFPQDRLASFSCSFAAHETSWYQLSGTKGEICLDNAYDYAQNMRMSVTANQRTTLKNFKKHDQFGAELVYFSNCILKNQKPEPSLYEGFADIAVIEAIQESIQRQTPVRVRPIRKMTRPSGSQRILKKAIHPPQLVHAQDPSKSH